MFIILFLQSSFKTAQKVFHVFICKTAFCPQFFNGTPQIISRSIQPTQKFLGQFTIEGNILEKLRECLIDLLQFGIVMSFNLCIGLVTPPVGLCLLLCNQTGETRLSHSLKAMMPMLLISIIVLFLITYVSPLTTLLPSIMAG